MLQCNQIARKQKVLFSFYFSSSNAAERSCSGGIPRQNQDRTPVGDLTCDEASDRESIECRIKNARSRFGWGITHI